MTTAQTEVINATGLHARPASTFVNTAIKYKSQISVKNLKTGKEVNAKSIVRLLSLGAGKGTRIEISASGEDEEIAVSQLIEMVSAGFGEV